MSRLGELGGKLNRGEVAIEFVKRRKIWYLITAVMLVISLGGLLGKGLYMGVEFQGGAVFTTPPTSISVEEARTEAQQSSGSDARVQRLGNDSLRITVTGLDSETSNKTREALAGKLGLETEQLDAELVGPSWGEQMTSKALTGMVIFLVLVTVYLSIAFEWRMALAALLALLHDLLITVGVYALVGFEVTPGTVVGVLTILGYSLYDTVVVFDKVNENTSRLGKDTRFTFAELANRGLNATVVRSVNTSIVALLPVGALLFIGAGLLGGGMLKDIALSLFIGLAAGTYSSIMIATPLVVDLKKTDSAAKAHDRRVLAKRAKAAKGEDVDQDDSEEPGGATAVSDDDPDDDAEEAPAAAGAGGRAGRAQGRGRAAGRRR
ncbi:protein translocase subunit SecF [Streptomyces durbertensis]|uniref:Protein-export membrane protein SecF n=1 Tax=Streptomyces durbertensis TaxID=2448886 RepID=A0ABR6ELS8_9ACTN|nr:protein translocase subunit SecF [Streptomyces durbertensis]MBB1246289.1 protein translocase subunit SecF [Streptomyces durbertensis]